MKTWVWWTVLGVALVGMGGSYVREVLHKPGTDLPVLGRVDNFSLIDQGNRPVSLKDLQGKTWIADFIYTTCPDQCPMMTRKMAALEELLPKQSKVHLVSITVDPMHDTPEALAQYASRYHADPTRWHFLTGQPEEVQNLLVSFNLLAPESTPKLQMMNHSTRLVMIDAEGRIRGYYDSAQEPEMQRLVKDVSRIAG